MGENFRFGKKARGDAEMLSSHSEFTTRVEPLVEVLGETVSSTRIRASIAAGDLKTATRLPRGAVPVRGRGQEGRPARADPRLPDREHRP